MSKPSAPQKRAIAKGKSLEMHSTLVFSKPLAFSLKVLIDCAQTPVSTLGNMLRTNLDPLKSAKVLSAKSVFVNLKSGAFVPVSGRFPTVEAGLPPNVILAIVYFFISVKSKEYRNVKCE